MTDEELARIVEALKYLVPDLDTSSPAKARDACVSSCRDLRAQAERVERLFRRWSELEADRMVEAARRG